ncbi:nitrite/sulfite reductase [Rubrivivax benzoatilyticus]|uniref:Nitrite/sulfite reductase n=1 Tax=Rubrivivax benzoatilyticus TaxID=316997 RepID=A0ABX0HZ05_9BURK|nr:nitrite/sulfite reductase [Rubrivivax benzoatilyticus]EGJ12109.1 putative nitrite/sulfite reductase [Rubrivivax benzoatilyticus JA2 = ATCC BAA-35]NHK98535.1 nitrite/sulfite reductase [Rubrivivax benzoatilyticus]NHL23690.1 nitrite/sulfite reductase [Rubrivivax benzoatilyticus]
MYQYTDFDRQFIRARAAQYRDQLERHLAGQLPDELFRPLRLQNGWYVQRHAPMARIAVPYGELSSRQLRALARVAREFDLQDAGTPAERGGFGHFTTRHNCQFNWIPLERSADVMELLAEADLHGVQTSGNCIRNVTTDALAGIAPDEIVDPRPYAELLRQWSTLHPEFAFLPRKFKVAITGATDDRAVIAWHDVGLQLLRDERGDVGFRVLVGGGMGRTPVIATEVAAFVPWQRILVFLEAVVRVYNLHGRRDNLYKARIKILVKALGEQFIREVHAEYEALLADGAPELPQAELDRVAAHFVAPVSEAAPALHAVDADAPKAYTRWLERNVHAHRLAGYRAVTLSLKRAGQAPGDVTADQMDRAAELAERFSHGELRVTHDQNLLLPWVAEHELRALWLAAREDGFATPNIGLLTDMIACPGGDLCSLANARSLPVAAAIRERFEDLDALYDLGDIDLHISGCMNSCGHHHTGHIGILGVDKDGSEWFQVTVAGSDGSLANGPAAAGKVIGPSFAADEVPDVVEALVELYRAERQAGERFVDTVRRLGVAPLRAAADAVRRSTAAAEA